MFHDPTVAAELVRLHQADLLRAAAESRRVAAARIDPAAGRPRRSAGRRTRQRIGRLLVAWGSRLAPVDPPTPY